ncbi:MAG TPA: hypothetical protein VEO36_08710 [Casimicrobiaceae bacterium]|nr:hypothetical protein [Casimicrobiaceae bacterium]
MNIRRVVLCAASLPLSVAAVAGPVEAYRTGPEFCPHDRTTNAPPLTEKEAIERARTLLPHDFCGPDSSRAAGPSQGANYTPSGGSTAAKPQAWGSNFVSGCDADSEWANGAWRVFVQQYKRSGNRKDAGGLTHSYVILDRVGNCLANIPGTELGSRN